MFTVELKPRFYLTFGYFLRAPDNSNFFRFPLMVRVSRSRLYGTYEKVGLAQMVKRPLSMREVPGSISGFSNLTIVFFFVHKRCLI